MLEDLLQTATGITRIPLLPASAGAGVKRETPNCKIARGLLPFHSP